MKIKLALIALLLIVGFAAVPTSEAACAGYVLSTWGVASTSVYNYVYLGTGSSAGNTSYSAIAGRFWQPGAYGSFNQGTYTPNGNGSDPWFVPYGAPDQFYINANTGDGQVVGCSTNNAYTLIETTTTDGKSAKFFAGGVTPTYDSAIIWDYSRFSTDWNLVEIVKPAVAVASKTGTVLTLNITPANLTNAYVGDIANAITGYRIMRSAAVGNPPGIDVGRVPGAWTLVQRVNPGTPLTGYAFDCATLGAGQDLFLGIQVEYDNAQVLGSYVGASTQVRCNSTLAKPGLGEKPKPKLR